jgi:hypothetical protein
MPLVKLQLKAGVNRESTALANEGQWFEADKVRFRAGYPEKIGGWVLDTGEAQAAYAPPTGSYWGVCRALWNWSTLVGNNLMALGTHLKYYIQLGTNGAYYDVTPLRHTSTIASNAFTTTNGSAVVVINDATHGVSDGDFLTISTVAGPVNGIPAASLNREFRATYIDTSTFSIEVDTAATSTGTAGACTIEYQIAIGTELATIVSGWGAGGWGGVTPGLTSTGWGEAAASGISVQMRLWSQSNYGEDLLINHRGGGIYLWKVGATFSSFDRAVLLGPTAASPYTTDAACPEVANGVMVSDASRFVIAFGCTDLVTSQQDPMLVRWSDQETYATWQPAATNQAGYYRLSIGSTIVAWEQARQEILVWTDAALYSMKYQGAPYVWGFDILGSNVSIISPNAHATSGTTTYWMGVDNFYLYNGRVQPLPCTLRQYIFGDINHTQGYQCFAGTNEGFNEVWFFYCSSTSDEIDRYVIYNVMEETWSHGSMARTAWLDTALRGGTPAAAGYDGQLVYHEVGVDDGTTSPPQPITAFVQSGDIDIQDGQNFGFVWRMLPDITFDGSAVNNPSVTFTLKPRAAPGAPYRTSQTPSVASTQNFQTQHTYTVQEYTTQVYVRVRGRVMAFRVTSDGLGVHWQLGQPRIDIRPDGRR